MNPVSPSPAYERDVALRDGSTILLRPARPEDRNGLRALIDGLSKRSAYFRFFGTARSTEAEVARLLTDDATSSVSLVADAGGTLLGVGSYVRHPTRPSAAEVGFLVADAAQGHGVGTQLLGALADIARDHAIDTFEADVLGGNDQMLQVFRDSGFRIQQDFGAGVCHLSFNLLATEAVEARSAGRAQVSAAASMRAFFEPGSVAVIGASEHRGKIGAEVLHNLISSGFAGQLFAVHPTATHIQAIPAYAHVASIPAPIDLAVICVPAAGVRAVADECIAKGVKALVVITAGFAETGDAGRAVEAELLTAVRRAGIRMVGPNCMGLLNTNPSVRLNATFSPVFPPPGRVAMLSQSGALGLAILDHARRLQIGLSTFVSVGNKADVSGNDLLQYWEQDDHTDVILLYLESFGNPRKFSQIARRLSRRKPIVAVKSGRSQVGARAATSHTGALAASDAVVSALFQQCGVIRTDTMEQLFDVTRVLSQQPVPRGRRVAVVTNAGGPGILAADACAAQGLELPALSATTATLLRALLPPAASVANPIDMLASSTSDQYERTLTAVLADDNVDSAIVIFIPPMVTAGDDVARAIKRAAASDPAKPVLSVFMGSEPAADLLRPIPAFVFPEAAASALAHATRYGAWQRSPVGAVPVFPDVDANLARATVASVLARGGGWAEPREAAALLRAMGIPTARAEQVEHEDAAVAASTSMGFPVALKAFGPTIIHKTELGAIRLNLATADDVRAAFRELKSALGESMTGVLVQEMVTGGVEMLVGSVEDPAFGPIVACALGGTTAELFSDSAFRLAPLTDLDATSMIDTLRCAPLLRGYRGAPVADERALRDALLRISTLVTLCPEIQEIDINPLRVLPEGVRALDIRVRVGRPVSSPNLRRIQYLMRGARTWISRDSVMAALALAGILAHLALRFGTSIGSARSDVPLYLVLGGGGTVLVVQLAIRLARGQFGSDLLAGISIVTAVLLGEYLAGSLVVLMLSGGQALEQFAAGRASAALQALAQRMPSIAHRHANGTVEDVALDAVAIGDLLTIFPHEYCPADGTVVAGHGSMNESYLTGEPFLMDKGPGTEVFSGAINGEQALEVRVTRRAVDSRYARIMRVMRESEQHRPKLRRLGDQLGAVYTPLAVGLAVAAWWWSGDPVRFLAVLVVATPCPLLIAIPVAIVGSISLAARRGIVVRDPSVLEQVDLCRTIVLDKTGTLTYGEPTLTDRVVAPPLTEFRMLQLAASVERYSRHPLAPPILAAARADGIPVLEATDIRERPGEGLEAVVDNHRVRIVGRRQVEALGQGDRLPESTGGLECVVMVDGSYAGTFRFRDAPRADSRSFIGHLWARHHYDRVLLVSGDREQEVRYLADHVGITDVHAGQSPEDKVAITRAESAKAATLFIGDGINDAPALAAATVGIAFGNHNEVTSEAAGVVIMDSSLKRVDEFFHISRRMRRIALQSAVGGMILSAAGMLFASAGLLAPVAGAIVQELIDLAAVMNALRASRSGRALSDY